MQNIKFVTHEEMNARLLSLEVPIVYNSDSLISSMSYSGSIEKIMQSTMFSDSFKTKLLNANGMVSLGSTNGRLRNVHVYSQNVVRLDGIERIWHLF